LGIHRGSAKPSANGRYRAQLRQQSGLLSIDFARQSQAFTLSATIYRFLKATGSLVWLHVRWVFRLTSERGELFMHQGFRPMT